MSFFFLRKLSMVNFCFLVTELLAIRFSLYLCLLAIVGLFTFFIFGLCLASCFLCCVISSKILGMGA